MKNIKIGVGLLCLLMIGFIGFFLLRSAAANKSFKDPHKFYEMIDLAHGLKSKDAEYVRTRGILKISEDRTWGYLKPSRSRDPRIVVLPTSHPFLSICDNRYVEISALVMRRRRSKAFASPSEVERIPEGFDAALVNLSAVFDRRPIIDWPVILSSDFYASVEEQDKYWEDCENPDRYLPGSKPDAIFYGDLPPLPSEID